MCYNSPMPRKEQSGLDKFLSQAMREDRGFRRLFWSEVAKAPLYARRKLEARLGDLPK